MEIAADEGFDVEAREIPVEEIFQGKFSEIAACGAFFVLNFDLVNHILGTAVVVTPIGSLSYRGQMLEIGSKDDKVGPIVRKLYDRVRAIQNGDAEDKFNWMINL
jgi:branched-chain amino acid aminotransferase